MVYALKKNNLLDACLITNVDIFHEIKKWRSSPNTTGNVRDGVSENIPIHFADIYNNLYNSVVDQEDVQKVYKTINDRINSLGLHHVLKVAPSIVLEAAGHLRSEKSDVSHHFSSDC